MGKIHKGTSLAVLLNLAGLTCIFLGHDLPAASLSLVAYFAAIRDLAKYTSVYQFVTISFSSMILGVSLDLSANHFPFLTLALFFAAAGSIARMAFFRVFSYTGYSWLEPILCVASLGIYFYANIRAAANWAEWVFPMPVLIFNGIICWVS